MASADRILIDEGLFFIRWKKFLIEIFSLPNVSRVSNMPFKFFQIYYERIDLL